MTRAEQIRNIGRSQFSEGELIENDSLQLLEKELGWTVIKCSKENKVHRWNEKTPILTEIFCNSLRKLNPWINDEHAREVIAILEKNIFENFDIKTNRDKYYLIRDGVDVSNKESGGVNKKKKVTLIDFNNPENNTFIAVSQLRLKGYYSEFLGIPDLVGFVNGIPLLFAEFKRYDIQPKEGYDNNYKNYLEEIPQLFAFNAFCVFSNGNETKVGAVGSPWEYYSNWNRLEEDEEGNTDISVLLRGMCNKNNFLDLFQNFIIFQKTKERLVKIVARNHQFLGVNLAFKSYEQRKEKEGKLGTFWHTQGSGKSLSMLFFAEKIKRKCGGNPIFIILCDRKELETQIYETFSEVGVLDSNRNCKVESKEDLKEKLKAKHSYVFSLIHKFHNASLTPIDEDREIIIIVDEAHRTQYGSMSVSLYKFLPKASRIGFTGTPLLSREEITSRYFGDYVSTYDFQKAIEDKVTVPLLYENRACKIKNIINPEINREMYREFNEGSRLPSDWKSKKQIWMREDRLKKNAEDFVAYYSGTERMFMGKVMYVCLNKVACVLMKNYVQEYWNKEIERLERSLSSYSPEEEETIQEIKRKIFEMKRTDMEIVYSSGGVDEDQIYEYDTDIEIPKSINEKEAEKRFKRRDGDDTGERRNLKIVFVCAMWMTGFDVKCLSFLVLDKLLKAHTLMQAIARPNRVDEGKDRGFILDYLNCSEALKDALKDWGAFRKKGEGDDKEVVIQETSKIIDNIIEIVFRIESFLARNGVSLVTFLNKTPEEKRKMFPIIKEKVIKKWYKDQINEKCEKLFLELKYVVHTDLPSDTYEKIDGIKAIYRIIKADVENKDKWQVKLTRILKKYIKADVNQENFLREISEEEIKNLSELIVSNPRSSKQSIFEDLKKDLRKIIEKNLDDNPTTINFFQEYNEIIDKWNEEIDPKEQERIFEELINFAKRAEEETVRFAKEGFASVQELVIYDICRKINYNGDIQELKDFCVDFIKIMKGYLKSTYQPFAKETTRSEINVRIKKIIVQRFPIPLKWEEILQIRQELFNYLEKIFREKWLLED
ncbi:type I restriction endonuclease subunit R [Mycoplasma suis]|uniref:Type I restriction enzyme endonuclease subunit n=1 Tax=Mycoplasma suis (strain Illinois) TaxID=768700 RepID=F0QS66_MYCSL|nr:HsdR family type I site-specific deoxyribonuclease [Mycoplasma suis]ADX98336.1 type I site-specific deoxyribonuclease, HsdR family protein [Mycoplasma suis str. Illinois]